MRTREILCILSLARSQQATRKQSHSSTAKTGTGLEGTEEAQNIIGSMSKLRFVFSTWKEEN